MCIIVCGVLQTAAVKERTQLMRAEVEARLTAMEAQLAIKAANTVADSAVVGGAKQAEVEAVCKKNYYYRLLRNSVCVLTQLFSTCQHI